MIIENKRKENEKKMKRKVCLFGCRENKKKEKFILYKMTHIFLININLLDKKYILYTYIIFI